MAHATLHDGSIAHILVIERGCRWPKRSGAAHKRAGVVVQRRSERPEVFARRVLDAVRDRSGRITSLVLIGNGCWDERALAARSVILRGILQLTNGSAPDIVLCTDASADERAVRAMGAFAATFDELAASAVRIRCLREPPGRPPRSADPLPHAA